MKPTTFAHLLLSGLLAPLAAFAAAPPLPTLDPGQLRPGQKAVVRTVFEGEKVEEFEAEILGVQRGGRTEGDMILARATSERVLRTGVAAGMSGSPVYVEGRLIGALSSGWSFSREPIFGITPIREMLEVLDQPAPPEGGGTAGPSGVDAPGLSAGVRYGEFRWDDDTGSRTPAVGDDPEGASPRGGSGPATSRPAGMTPLLLPLATGGLNALAAEPMRQAFTALGFELVPGGRAAGGGPAPETLVPGSAVAVDVLRGDLQFSAIGTLTYRDGDRVLLFGHPFFQSGDVRLPFSTARITTIVASQQSSFKLGATGRPAGVATQDRRAAVAGRIGGTPRLLPFAVSVGRAPGRAQRFRFETVEDRALAPLLIATASLNSVLESGGMGANQTVRFTLTLHRRGAPPLALSDLLAGDAPVSELPGAIGSPLRFLLNNPFERLTLDSATVAIEIEPGRRQWTLRTAQVLDAAVRPGGRVRVRCEVERWRGGTEARDLVLTIPEEVPDGRYVLWLGGGTELSRYEAARLPGRYRPTSLPDAWHRLAAQRGSDALYGALFARAPEVTRDGRDYPELPLSALSLLSSGQTAGDAARRGEAALLDEVRLSLPGQLRGEMLLQVNVDSSAP